MNAASAWILTMSWGDFGLVVFGASMIGIILGLLTRRLLG